MHRSDGCVSSASQWQQSLDQQGGAETQRHTDAFASTCLWHTSSNFSWRAQSDFCTFSRCLEATQFKQLYLPGLSPHPKPRS